MTVSIRMPKDLLQLQRMSGQSLVVVDLTQIKYRGLALLAIRQAYCATRPGGLITIIDRTARRAQAIEPFLIGWPTLRALSITALGNFCELDPTSEPGEMRFRRTSAALAPGWSAGVMFSGNDCELPTLFRCLDGLTAQPELRGKAGEIIVCGPARDTRFLNGYTDVRYLAYDFEPTAGPFPISRKKNALLQAMAFPRRLVLHGRIVLDPGAIAQAPKEFDVLALNVMHRSSVGEEANVGLICIDPGWPVLTPRRFERATLNAPGETYLDLYARGRPYVDGGAFAVSAPVYEACPLNEDLLWGDCEDVEWCFRAQSLGFAVDMAPGMRAVNSVSKVRTLESWPRLIANTARATNRIVRGVRNLARRLFEPNTA